MLKLAARFKLFVRVSGVVAISAILSSCFHDLETTQSLLPVDVAFNKEGTPVFYVDRHSFIKRYGIRGVLITKDNVSACELENNKQSDRATVWGYEITTSIEEGDTLNQQNLDEFPKEIIYGVIPPKMNQDVTTLEKNIIYHADVSIVFSHSSKVDSFRRGDLVFIIDSKDEIISRDLQAMCDLEKALAEAQAVSEVIAKVQ